MDDYENEFEDEDYMYMEDTYIQADDLAEHAIASPVPYDGDDDIDPEHWRFEYWMDIEYDSDGDAVRARQADSKEARLKRKRKELATSSTVKRRKVQDGTGIKYAGNDSPAVLLVNERVNEMMKSPEKRGRGLGVKPWALLGDWREKLENAPIFAKRDLNVKLADVVDEPEYEDDEDGDVLDMEEGEPTVGGDGEDDMGPLGEIDPEVLKMALRQQMAAQGLTGVDEDMLMAFASRMLAGEGEADDIAGELADNLLEQEEENEEDEAEGGALSQWVSQQVQTSKGATTTDDTPLTPTKTGAVAMPPHEDTPVHRRPPTPASTATSSSVDSSSQPGTQAAPVHDSPIEGTPPRGQKRKAVTDIEEKRTPDKKNARASSPQPQVVSPAVKGKKRKADVGEEAVAPQAKRPARMARGFDAPTAASKSRAVSGSAPVQGTAKSSTAPAKGIRKGRKG
ncbi:hypothetical protein EJ08DRAFT_733848 [Tothia fuscella]|uniref:Uncharacterized protein n=1 Tax=Tothia fuscella TaxID=1048955 RepID=A0A9P4NSH8_9PEZI|nr:hypothetical protein EJ08DRAFT_733848 [Tothia fuscella]